MTKKLLRDYIENNRLWTYDDSDIENVRTAGHLVIFNEVSAGGHYSELHEIPLLDIMAWIYSKVA